MSFEMMFLCSQALQGLVHLRVVKIHYLITDLVTGQLFDAVLVPPIFSQIEGFSEKL
jgi:hypothetical protein